MKIIEQNAASGYPCVQLFLGSEEQFEHSGLRIRLITIIPATTSTQDIAPTPLRFYLSGEGSTLIPEFHLGDVQREIPGHLQGAVHQQLARFIARGPVPAQSSATIREYVSQSYNGLGQRAGKGYWR